MTQIDTATVVKLAANRRAFGLAVRRALCDLGVLPEQAGAELGYVPDTVWGVIAGECRAATTLAKVADYCGLDPAEVGPLQAPAVRRPRRALAGGRR